MSLKRKICCLAAIFICILCAEAQNRCIFVQISDPQFGFREEQGFACAQALLEKAVMMTNALEPDFVVVTGDMVNSPDDSLQFSAYMETIGKISGGIPVYHIPGNHDIGRDTETGLRRYAGRYGYDRFAFEQGGCAFIGINSPVIKEMARPYERQQYRWLKRHLRDMKDAGVKIIFSHIPPVLKEYGEPENYSNFPVRMQKKYIPLFARHGVTAVISGHLHDMAECTAKGIRMITSGPCGKPLGKGFSGIGIGIVDGQQMEWCFIGLETQDNSKLTDNKTQDIRK